MIMDGKQDRKMISCKESSSLSSQCIAEVLQNVFVQVAYVSFIVIICLNEILIRFVYSTEYDF